MVGMQGLGMDMKQGSVQRSWRANWRSALLEEEIIVARGAQGSCLQWSHRYPDAFL